MIRKSPMPRRTGSLRRKSAMPKKNPKRRKSEWARAYGSPERVAFVQSLPCVAKNAQCSGPIENAHVGIAGMGRKADARSIVPMCSAHHRGLHFIGARSWQLLADINLEVAAAKTESLWLASTGGAAPRTED